MKRWRATLTAQLPGYWDVVQRHTSTDPVQHHWEPPVAPNGALCVPCVEPCTGACAGVTTLPEALAAPADAAPDFVLPSVATLAGL